MIFQVNTTTPSPMMSPEDGTVLTQRATDKRPLAPAERSAAFIASPRNSLSRGMWPPGAGGGGGGGRWWQVTRCSRLSPGISRSYCPLRFAGV